jgi:hypothetical protein
MTHGAQAHAADPHVRIDLLAQQDERQFLTIRTTFAAIASSPAINAIEAPMMALRVTPSQSPNSPTTANVTKMAAMMSQALTASWPR